MEKGKIIKGIDALCMRAASTNLPPFICTVHKVIGLG